MKAASLPYKPVDIQAELDGSKALNKAFTYKWFSDDEVLVKMKRGHIGTITIIGIMRLGYDVVACRREINDPRLPKRGYASYRWIRFKKRADGKEGEFLDRVSIANKGVKTVMHYNTCKSRCECYDWTTGEPLKCVCKTCPNDGWALYRVKPGSKEVECHHCDYKTTLGEGKYDY